MTIKRILGPALALLFCQFLSGCVVVVRETPPKDYVGTGLHGVTLEALYWALGAPLVAMVALLLIFRPWRSKQ